MKYFIVILISISPLFCKAQGFMPLSLEQVDSLFIQNNFLLLSQKYNITAVQAQIIQQKLWPNPQASAEINIYNPNSNKFFDVGGQGQRIFAIQQMVELAGKRNKRSKIAFYNAQLSVADFYDLLRSLKFELHTSFYSAYFTLKTIEIYKEQLRVLGEIIEAFEKQEQKGNISLKELLRLKSLEFQLKNDFIQEQYRALEEEKSLKILTGRTDSIVPLVKEEKLAQIKVEDLINESLVDRALENRPDVRIFQLEVAREEMNLQLQKAYMVPDMHVGIVYDRLGSAFNNYFGLSTTFDLPIWNRNQGNIKSSKASLDARQFQLNNKLLEVTNEVSSSISKAKIVDNNLRSLESNFITQLETLNAGVLSNFQKRNLSLIEFIDFFESYNESIKQINRLKSEKISALEELNYYIGAEVFR